MSSNEFHLGAAAPSLHFGDPVASAVAAAAAPDDVVRMSSLSLLSTRSRTSFFLRSSDSFSSRAAWSSRSGSAMSEKSMARSSKAEVSFVGTAGKEVGVLEATPPPRSFAVDEVGVIP